MDVVVIAADRRHVDVLAYFARQMFSKTFGHLYTTENLQHHLDTYFSPHYFDLALAAGEQVLIAQLENELVGYIMCGNVALPVAHEAGDKEIHRLYVGTARQGQGVGRVLMQMALQTPALRSAGSIFLGVWENNKNAQRFYEQYGFQRVGEYLYHVGTQADRELIMCKRRDAAQ